ncbi:hypothetical protein BDV25DRAFT_163329 [Aspergillus avenaceus]|uniref:Uncharacterized protein n=1 Tax=Aspergillus avenaceus TaxID=36643 RepID=A0A5N6TI28_ASPAV|nr:hypothetical protein BDV25DRAFT_163329 [Aspergillus avenaceus]
MQFSKSLIAISAALVSFVFAQEAPAQTLTIQVVPVTTATPAPTSVAASSSFVTPSSSVRVSSTPLFSRTPTPTPSETPSSNLPLATGGAPAVRLSNAMAAGVVAAAGFALL